MRTSLSTGFHSSKALPLTAPSPQPARKCFNRNTRPCFKPDILWQQKLEEKKLSRHLNNQRLINRTPDIMPNPQHHRSTRNRSSTAIITSILDNVARLASKPGTLTVKLLILSTLVASSTARHINDTTPAISTTSLFRNEMLSTRSGTNRTTSLQNPDSDSSESHILQHILWACMMLVFIGIMASLVSKMASIRDQHHEDPAGAIRTKLTAKI